MRKQITKDLVNVMKLIPKKDQDKGKVILDNVSDHIKFLQRFNMRRMIAYGFGGVIALATIIFEASSRTEIGGESFNLKMTEGYLIALAFAFLPDVANLIRDWIEGRGK